MQINLAPLNFNDLRCQRMYFKSAIFFKQRLQFRKDFITITYESPYILTSLLSLVIQLFIIFYI